MLIDKDAMCVQKRTETEASFIAEKGKSCPTEILNAISSINADGRPIWKPMHMQPIYKYNEFVCLGEDVGGDIFERGLCLPSDIKMTEEEQDRIIEVIRACFE
jgi:dTDP-4-amino-4,6-dideoxygalactose transaminase